MRSCSKVIWLGDLNYRLAAAAGWDSSTTTREMIEKNDWQELLKRDQVRGSSEIYIIASEIVSSFVRFFC